MSFDIIWSEQSLNDFNYNISYLEERFGSNEIERFIERTEHVISIIKNKPLTFQALKYKDIHFVPIVSQITLFYQVGKSNQIYLLRFWNNHQNPLKLFL